MYQLPNLPYDFQELEPFIDTHALALHYHKHEQNYINKLNELLKKNNYDYRYSLAELLYHINEFEESDREDILFNVGGILNHNLYWKSMNPNPQKPIGNLWNAIQNKYESYESFFDLIKNKALSIKGSGYVFLVTDENKQLNIITTKDQNTPLSNGYIPLFNIDMWEHAYYINYENNKSEYLDNFENIADFTNANKIFNDFVR